jgi:hypothetical protein
MNEKDIEPGMNIPGKSLNDWALAGRPLFIGAGFFLAAVTLGEALVPGYNIHKQPISNA